MPFRLQFLLHHLAYLNASRALCKARGNWFLRELIRKRLDAHQMTPGEVIRVIRAWRDLPL